MGRGPPLPGLCGAGAGSAGLQQRPGLAAGPLVSGPVDDDAPAGAPPEEDAAAAAARPREAAEDGGAEGGGRGGDSGARA